MMANLGITPTGQQDDNIDDLGRNVASGQIDEARHPQAELGNEAAAERQPKGDHNRRLALGYDPEQFAALAGITAEALREYESTPPDGKFNLEVATLVGETLDRIEGSLPDAGRH